MITLILQSLIPAISTLPWEWLRTLSLWDWHASRAAEAQVSVVMGSGTGIDLHHWPNILLATIAIVYAAMTVYFAARFLWRATTLAVIRREAVAPAHWGSSALLGTMLKSVCNGRRMPCSFVANLRTRDHGIATKISPVAGEHRRRLAG